MRLVRNALIALAITAIVPALASAQTDTAKARPQGQGGDARRAGGMRAALLQGITVTDEQKAELDKLAASFREEGMALRAQMQPGTPPDDAFRAKMQDFQKRQMDAFRKVLTADQQKTFDTNVAEMQKRMQEQRRG